jgi:hypothetical protein
MHCLLPLLTCVCHLGAEQVLLLYRRILKAAKLFPSVKRGAILDDIKHQFREHKVGMPVRLGGVWWRLHEPVG